MSVDPPAKVVPLPFVVVAGGGAAGEADAEEVALPAALSLPCCPLPLSAAAELVLSPLGVVAGGATDTGVSPGPDELGALLLGVLGRLGGGTAGADVAVFNEADPPGALPDAPNPPTLPPPAAAPASCLPAPPLGPLPEPPRLAALFSRLPTPPAAPAASATPPAATPPITPAAAPAVREGAPPSIDPAKLGIDQEMNTNRSDPARTKKQLRRKSSLPATPAARRFDQLLADVMPTPITR